MDYKKSPYVIEAKAKDNVGYWLFNTWNRKLKFLNNFEYDDYLIDKIDAKKLEILIRDSFLIDANTDLKQLGKDVYTTKCLSDRTLFVTIMPTMACNFRCFYCYEDHDPSRMTSSMQDLVIQAIINKLKEYDSLRIEWFGGEPLLEIETIINISEKLISYCKENRKSYIASMTTNGYLLTYNNYFLLKTKCKIMYYQVTIDGIKNEHDQSRPLRDGGGTFDKIITNLKDIKCNEKSSLVKICIRTNYTTSSILHRKEWELYLREVFLDDRKFTYIPKMAWNNYQNESLNKKYLPIEFGSSLLSLDDPTASHDNFAQALMDLNIVSKGECCYASKPNTIVIGPNGQLMKCTVHLNNEINNIGFINSNKKFEINPINECFWVKESVDDKCLSCSVFPICLAGGGCRYRYHRTQHSCEKEHLNIIRHLNMLPYNSNYIESVWS